MPRPWCSKSSSSCSRGGGGCSDHPLQYRHSIIHGSSHPRTDRSAAGHDILGLIFPPPRRLIGRGVRICSRSTASRTFDVSGVSTNGTGTCWTTQRGISDALCRGHTARVAVVPGHWSERYRMGLEPVQARVRNARKRHLCDCRPGWEAKARPRVRSSTHSSQRLVSATCQPLQWSRSSAENSSLRARAA